MQIDIVVCKTLCLESIVKRVVRNRARVESEEGVLCSLLVAELHIISEPAFNPSSLVVIASCAFRRVFASRLKTENIKLTYVFAYFLEALY